MATELEILKHAKNYLDQLANGRNPLTGEVLPSEDIVNNVRISRCLFYASDVLRQVIDKGGLNKTKRSKPFSLTPEQLEKFEYFPKPNCLTAMIDRLNALADDPEMHKISYKNITAFLENQGYLQATLDGLGKKKRMPTERGLALGITAEERYGYYGAYTVLLYDNQAQHYIIDHLPEIAVFKSPRTQENDNSSAMENVDPETGEILAE